MLTRRFFLGGLLAGAAAPAIVRAESIMRVAPPKGWVMDGGLLLRGDLLVHDNLTTDKIVIIGYAPYWREDGTCEWLRLDGRAG